MEYVEVGGRPYQVCEKDGSKRVRLTIGTDYHTGRQLQREYTGRSAEEIQKKIDSSLSLSDSAMQLLPEDKKLKALIQGFLAFKTLSVCTSTLKKQELTYRKHIDPYLGDQSVRNIQREDVLRWQERLQREGRSGFTIAEAFTLLSSMMEYACQRGYLHANPCRYAALVRRVWNDQSILNKGQLERLLKKPSDQPYSGFFVFTLLLALRKGEARGLSWKQIDWERGTVCICQQGTKKQIIQPYTKTGRIRTLLMPQYALMLLKYQRKFQEKEAKANPIWQNPNDLVFTDKDGRMLEDGSIDYHFQKIMAGCGENRVSLHSLRRTTASVLAEKVSMHAAQYYLGHASVRTTFSYVYPSEKGMEHLVQTMGDYFEKRMEQADSIRQNVGKCPITTRLP